jgi:hypothetical protein
MADRDIIIGRVINVTGMIGVLAGLVLFAFVLVLLIFRRGLGFDIVNSFRGFGSLLVFSMAAFRQIGYRADITETTESDPDRTRR